MNLQKLSKYIVKTWDQESIVIRTFVNFSQKKDRKEQGKLNAVYGQYLSIVQNYEIQEHLQILKKHSENDLKTPHIMLSVIVLYA